MTCCTLRALDVLHKIFTRLRPGHSNMLETVCSAVRRLKQISNCSFQCVHYYYHYYYYIITCPSHLNNTCTEVCQFCTMNTTLPALKSVSSVLCTMNTTLPALKSVSSVLHYGHNTPCTEVCQFCTMHYEHNTPCTEVCQFCTTL